jgi:hypothetical protein
MTGFGARGWVRFGHERAVESWARAARRAALVAVDDPANSDWLRCDGTWFVGVNLLANDARGALAGGPPLAGRAVEVAHEIYGGPMAWDRAQVSVVYPGYPRQGEDSDAAYRFRRLRDAAHLDGLLRIEPGARRMLREPQAFVLGIPLVATSPDASPVVVWEGSHLLMAAALGAVLRRHEPQRWRDVDLTEVYKAARRQCFKRCQRVVVHAEPGEAYLLHRLTLHGVSPWGAGAVAPDAGRMIAYFRPELRDVAGWIEV